VEKGVGTLEVSARESEDRDERTWVMVIVDGKIFGLKKAGEFGEIE
jgi:hypothetical protein